MLQFARQATRSKRLPPFDSRKLRRSKGDRKGLSAPDNQTVFHTSQIALDSKCHHQPDSQPRYRKSQFRDCAGGFLVRMSSTTVSQESLNASQSDRYADSSCGVVLRTSTAVAMPMNLATAFCNSSKSLSACCLRRFMSS